MITGGTTFFISILLAKTLGADGYGNFIKITTYVSIFYLFADFGLNAAYLTKKTSDQSLFTIRCLLGMLLLFGVVSLLAFLPGTPTYGYTMMVKFGIILFAPTIVCQALITTANAFFQKKLRYDLAAWAVASGSLVSLFFIVVSTYIFLPSVVLFAGIISLFLGSMTTAGIGLWFSKRLHFHIGFEWDSHATLTLVKTALPLGLTLLCNVIYFHADSIILTLSRSTFEVGIYGLAYKFFEFPLVVPIFVMNSVFPFFITSLETKKYKKFFRQGFQALLGLFSISLCISGILYLFIPLVEHIKPEFAASIVPFRILSAGIPIFYVTSVTMWMLISLKKNSALFAIYGMSMIGNIVANIIFIPQYGYIAAAWVTVLSECIVLFMSFFVIWKQYISLQYNKINTD